MVAIHASAIRKRLQTGKDDDAFSRKEGFNSGFDWVPSRPGFEQLVLDASDVITLIGVPQKILLTHIRGCSNIEDSIKNLPFALFLVIFFLVMHQVHDNPAVAQGLQKALQHNIEENAVFGYDVPGGGMAHKNLYDIHFAADFWSWMRLGLAPLLFPSTWATSEASNLDLGDLSDFQREYHMYFNLKIGAMRLRQEVSQRSTCINSELEAIYGSTCSTDSMDISLAPLEFDVARSKFVEATELTQWFQYLGNETGATSVQARMLDLEEQRWLNKNTARAEVSFIVYNGNNDLITLFKVHVLLSRSGRFWKELTFVSLFMNNYSNPWAYVCDLLLYGHITAIFLAEMVEVVHKIRENHGGGFRRCLRDYITVWNAIDWVSIIMGYCMLILWIVVNIITQRLSDAVEELSASGSTCEGFSSCSHVASVYEDFESITELFFIYRMCAAFYPFVLMLRLFQAFSKQPRLASVTRTLAGAADDLIHFGIVSLAVFATYCIMGCVLFGRHMADFATMDRAMMTCFRILLGDMDFHEMEEIGRPLASLYVSSFLLLMLFIMLNMFIAIIMDVYDTEKSRALSSQTLAKQSLDLVKWTYERYRGRMVSLDDILETYTSRDGSDAFSSDVKIRVENFMDTVPNLTEHQAKSLLKNAAEAHQKEHGHNVSESDIMDFIALMARNDAARENPDKDGTPSPGLCSLGLRNRGVCGGNNAKNTHLLGHHPHVSAPSFRPETQTEPRPVMPVMNEETLGDQDEQNDMQFLLDSAPVLDLLTIARRRVDEETQQGMKVGALRKSLINAEKLCRERDRSL